MQSLKAAKAEVADMLKLAEESVKNAHYWSREGAHEQAQVAMVTARGAIVELKEALEIADLNRKIYGNQKEGE